MRRKFRRHSIETYSDYLIYICNLVKLTSLNLSFACCSRRGQSTSRWCREQSFGRRSKHASRTQTQTRALLVRRRGILRRSSRRARATSAGLCPRGTRARTSHTPALRSSSAVSRASTTCRCKSSWCFDPIHIHCCIVHVFGAQGDWPLLFTVFSPLEKLFVSTSAADSFYREQLGKLISVCKA